MTDNELKAHCLSEESQPFTGWDFTHLKGRMIEDELPWSYMSRAAELMDHSSCLLDMGTGGGERLLELKAHWPPTVTVTEEYLPNWRLARERLEPLGVLVRRVAVGRVYPMPFPTASFDLILNRHSGFDCGEVARTLTEGGVFLTQQVHGLSAHDLTAEFGAEPQWPDATPSYYVPRLREAGLTITFVQESEGKLRFTDVGAIVYYLKAVPWLVPGFTVSTHFPVLKRLHLRLQDGGTLEFAHKMYIIETRKVSSRGEP